MNNLSCTFKRTAFVAASLLFTVAAFAQKSIVFKMEYLPLRQYTMGVNMQMDMTMDMKGDSAEAIKAQSGGAFPMKMLANNYMEMTVNTGARPANAKKFPLKMKYAKMDTHVSMNGNEMPAGANPLTGMEINGWAGGDAFVEIDTTSMAGKTLGPGVTTATLGKMMNSIMQKINFPARSLSVGESFDQTLDMPLAAIPGLPMNLACKITYKLTGVNNGIADFDMVTNGTLNMKGDTAQPMNMTATMNGVGKLKFSEKDRFFTEMNNDMTMNFSMEVQKNTMVGDMKMAATYKVTMAPNK